MNRPCSLSDWYLECVCAFGSYLWYTTPAQWKCWCHQTNLFLTRVVSLTMCLDIRLIGMFLEFSHWCGSTSGLIFNHPSWTFLISILFCSQGLVSDRGCFDDIALSFAGMPCRCGSVRCGSTPTHQKQPPILRVQVLLVLHGGEHYCNLEQQVYDRRTYLQN